MHEANVSEPSAYGFANSLSYTLFQKPDSEMSQAFLIHDRFKPKHEIVVVALLQSSFVKSNS